MTTATDRRDSGTPTDADIQAYIDGYANDTDAHGAPAPTVEEVRAAIERLDLAAALLGPSGELGMLRGDDFKLADEVLGTFIRALSPGDSYYAALDLRKSIRQTQYTCWLGLPVPGHDEADDREEVGEMVKRLVDLGFSAEATALSAALDAAEAA